MTDTPRTNPLDAAWEALYLALVDRHADPYDDVILADHRPAIEAEARAFVIEQGVVPAEMVAVEVGRALRDAAERVRALPVHRRRNGFATPTTWVTLRSVLAILEPKP